ncbi:unnamed protein product [Rotaria sp. Silwood1]|nr:unnamed protein product [Rotaria sp. Silwood1]CAF1525690.1 unnamed protein product [Rotaria sp. Silwood1]CAF3601800.1 unnamed protein product [Rotaria sp. Silwood1]CAF4669943.1 unnamed protein product [Rotaria sp. Silwood1]CAF4740025.1 unnamed protein product [Rotaria sp. Silwood1]
MSQINKSEQYFERNINELRAMLLKNIDDFREFVLSSKVPASAINDPNYAEQEEAYIELLRLSTALINEMHKTIGKILDQYHIFLEDIWNAICADEDPSLIVSEFQNRIERLIKDKWDPIFVEINRITVRSERL